MKKNLWILMMTVWVMSFAACSDDKEDETIAERVAGTYTGTLVVTMEDGSPMGKPLEGQKIYITGVNESTVNLELKDFKFGEIPVGDLRVPNVTVAENGSISGKVSEVPIIGGVIKADLVVSGTLKDNKADLQIIVNAPLTAGADPIVMNVTFKGSK